MHDEYIVDLHIHSKFSRACSRDLVLPKIAETAALKGIHLVGTGDFTHPEWFQMMKNELQQNDLGFYEVKNVKTFRPVEFVPTAEISCIYSKNGAVRRLHLLVVAPTFEIVEKINRRLEAIGNIHSDGRPILGLDAKELLKIMLDVSDECLMIPAHAWTPWFSIFGSKSGFDSIEECFEELASHITSIETGLSSDPPMNWRLSKLDNITLVSNSDAHSLDNLGREANVFKRGEGMIYQRLINILRGQNKDDFLYTIEFYPEEGKYHFDGHAVCGVRLTPEETERYGGRCPKCQKLATVGVLNRVNELADQSGNDKISGRTSFKSIVPLREILAEVLNVGKHTKSVDAVYRSLVPRLGSEFDVLIYASIADIAAVGSKEIALAVEKMRERDIEVVPGYDGVFGTVHIFKEGERHLMKQDTLFG
ncbi:hypothetical protein A3H10_02925 [Candidatus Uhrbacteria bacterium RIFCSPLOWO2_12_FULL_46_10]|uniref:DNA helicase UvrD n=1 Tax=Candidatus Uhrbacteria bacterium RIFCSPLOWO2_01_FULL_47_25 TaxID=1802402 RepID=A0A1F7UXV4_9BACT|nr:MAG: UvrD/REP helicase [Parcubacteria group bacterium GW2011_GWA2_46_9]OGL59659.1 MAG: hypothetical protein A2752_04940 [Candidatus Uhrbacteria bacterium RIFCSPHIGHO2_01_FULL_46_23]OGL68050.1 MAG: hypothetical protein A3D60_02865 [Candidatus Uhrbacteria bacterium RIFCSPHIGHO2_02_FULL_47_29]OGL76226.1 MAG: hypothetical protein A3E96_03905 [Candidatus Uhrbacteria bacterium RIFCSPHIGHO2_12_FULL_46_13]OGL82507.1 MAG: hypothetical protein A2936_03745 [Candidatus Uhrbacteria bacterium RIFCSPLOWO2_